jgi:hypothetical protein
MSCSKNLRAVGKNPHMSNDFFKNYVENPCISNLNKQLEILANFVRISRKPEEILVEFVGIRANFAEGKSIERFPLKAKFLFY